MISLLYVEVIFCFARLFLENTSGAKIITRTTFIVGELMSLLHTHISYTAIIVDDLICVMRVFLWCLFVLPLSISLKTVTSLNKEARLLKFHLS